MLGEGHGTPQKIYVIKVLTEKLCKLRSDKNKSHHFSLVLKNFR